MPYVKRDPGSEVVISGISGRYPSCQNVEELKEKIMDKQDLITETTRWNPELAGVPRRIGQIPNLEKFDAAFFNMSIKQSEVMDPSTRILMELTYEAIVDAGYNPAELRGRKIAVVIGLSNNDPERAAMQEPKFRNPNGSIITAKSKAMTANRISYWMDIHGPSYAVDTACSSSGFALEQCYRMILSGECEGAIVGGINLCIDPAIMKHFNHLGVLSPDGRCKTFDESANGYVRSDATSVVYLQRARDAKRIYSTVVHCKTNTDGYKKEGVVFPSSKVQGQLLKEFYDECNILPNALNYLEAHGTGTSIGDVEEIRAVDDVICKKRTKPLKIGSIKTNLGHSEPASCLSSIAKVIIAMETGIIPPIIHYKEPRQSITAIMEGRVEVVTEKTEWELGYAALNSFGFGGANAHILLKSNTKEKVNNGLPKDDLSRVVMVSGRTEAAVNSLLDSVEKVGVDVEYIRLLHDVHAHNIPKHVYRGFTTVGSKHTMSKVREIIPYNEISRPVWFVFPGMGCQWPEMGKMLMRLPMFSKSIEQCNVALRPRGINIVHIITTNDETIFDNILNCFVGITAIQIGLVDLLSAVGIVPDNVIGHSFGELGCAYADGCFTLEQTILAAYARGLALIKTEMIDGAMAAIGLGAQELEKMCPADIDVVCHNSSTSCTISGPSASIKTFVGKLTEKKAFAKEVASAGVAFHSRYIAKAGPKLLAHLREVIPEPKARSKKWLSSSVPEKDWSTEAAKYSSPEYHTNNLLSKVLFEETARHIPENAICIEIAPHGLLQAILRKSLSPNTANIPLTLRHHKDNAEFFVQALGKLYNLGLQPKIANLYPPVSFPVSRRTPMVAPHIKWDHSRDWYVPEFRDLSDIGPGKIVKISTEDETYQYMSGHIIDGKNLLPATGYLSLVWELLAQMKGCQQTSMSVVFEDVRFARAITIPSRGATINLSITITKDSGHFEILEEEGEAALVSGKVSAISNPASKMVNASFLPVPPGEEDLDSQDIYQELTIRGYNYRGLFQSLKSAAIGGTKGHIVWHDNYVTFIDNMLQLQILTAEKRALYVPTNIRKLVINTQMHQEMAKSMEPDKKEFPVYTYRDLDLIVSGGVQLFGLISRSIPRRRVGGTPVVEEYKFIAHRDRAEVSMDEMMRLSSHLALETQRIMSFTVLEIVDDDIPVEDFLSPILLRVLDDLPLVQPTACIAASEEKYKDTSLPSDVSFIEPGKLPAEASISIAIGRNLLTKEKKHTLEQILPSLRVGGFILTEEDAINDATISQALASSLNIILEKCIDKKTLLLLRKRLDEPNKSEVVSVSSEGLDWLEKIKESINRSSETEAKMRIILVTQRDKECGIMGMLNCIRREPGGQVVDGVIIEDDNAPMFALDNPFYSQQLKLDLPFNILRNGVWGSYKHLPLPAPKPKLAYHAFIDQAIRGDLSSLRWLEGPVKPSDRTEDQIRAIYVALNFKDVMLATGRLPEEVVSQRKNTTCTPSLLGFEYSGITARGERRFGFLTVPGISNIYHPEVSLTWKVPDYWSLEDAATVSAAYGTACYAFYVVDSIKKGEKILIHSGSGGVGQAAIHLALEEGLEVFTTVGTPDKRRFIRERFPSIADDHIGNSRDTSFEYMISRQTNGRGVDIVLNSLAEDKLLASMRCLAHYGRFLEIGKYDIAANNALNMLVFIKELSFKSIMLDYTLSEANGKSMKRLEKVVQDFLDRRRIQPLTRKVFDKEMAEAAFRYMGGGSHIGKVLIKICDEKGPYDKPILAYPRFYCSKLGSSVIIGGLGGLGLEVADWLSSRGARNLVLVSRRGVTTGYQKLKIQKWRTEGINVLVIKEKECSKREDCEYVLKAAAKLGPVDAIFNLAVQLRDGIFTNQTVETFKESLRPKVGITKQLDQLSRILCPELRYFVVFSSVSCGHGNAGVSNYGYGNAVMERICERRVAEGLPALAIQWGAVAEVGIVVNMMKENKKIATSGTLEQNVSSCMHEMETFLLQNHPVVSSMVVAEKSRPDSTNTPLQAVLNILGVSNFESVDKDTPLTDFGMDSMLGVEVKESLERNFDISLSLAEMRVLNFRKLMALSGDQKAAAALESESKKTYTELNDEDADLLWGTSQVISTMTRLTKNTSTAVDFPIATDNSGIRVFLFPGISADIDVFSPLLTNLKYSATCLQYPHSEEHKTINSIAEYLLPYIVGRVRGVFPMILVGFSFGSFVVTEIAKKLESLGHELHIIFIDATPQMLKRLNFAGVKIDSESDIYNAALSNVANKISPSSSLKYTHSLKKLGSLTEKIESLMPDFGFPNVQIEYQMGIAKGFCTRFYASFLYEPDESPQLKSPITLLKGTKGLVNQTDGHYDLKKLTKGAIKEVSISGDHVTILQNKEVASVINNLVVNA